jgi:hypothetical protein
VAETWLEARAGIEPARGAVTPLMEAGKVFLPESAPWLADFIDEMAAFPNGVHDDAVDSTTQALNYLRLQTSFSLLELFDKVNSRRRVSTRRRYGRRQ